MVRAASNGISGIIDPYGRVATYLTANDESHIDMALPKSMKLLNITKLITLTLGLLNFGISLLYVRLFWDVKTV